MSIKNTGKFALVQRILDEEGNDTGVVRARITADILLKQGQTVFFNDFEAETMGLVDKIPNYTEADAIAKVQKRAQLDAEYKQKTLYSLRAGKLPEVATGQGSTL